MRQQPFDGLRRTPGISPYRADCACLLVRGYTTLNEIQDDDLKQLSTHYSKGIDVLDAALCALGIFARTPKHGSTRHSRRRPLTDHRTRRGRTHARPFRDVMTLYLETYTARVSDTYTTRRGKTIAIAHFWRYLTERHPEVTSPALVRPLHLREYIPHIMAHALTVKTRQQNRRKGKQYGCIPG